MRAGGEKNMRIQRTRVCRRVAADNGFTVVEMVAASVILFIVLMGVLGAVQYAGASTQMAAMRQGAVNVATQEIEYDRNIPWVNLGIVNGNPAGVLVATSTITASTGTYTISRTVQWVWDARANQAAYKMLTAKISWSTPTSGSFSIQTAVYGSGASGNLADVMLIARDVDNPSVRVPGVSVGLTPSGQSTQYAVSQTDGTLVWADVNTGIAAFPACADPNWLYDASSSPGAPNLVAGPNNIGYLDCQRPCTATFHVKTTSLATYPYGATVTLVDKDRSITYTGTTNANGDVTFSNANGNVNGKAGLWKSKTLGYSATAAAGSSTSPANTFTLTLGGQAYSGTLTLPDPPSITVTKVVAGTSNLISGPNWDCTVKNPSGTVIGTYSGNADAFTVAISAAGNYTVSVANVKNGTIQSFLDTSTVFAASAAGANQACKVPMSPLFTVGVQATNYSLPINNAKVSVTNAVTSVGAFSTAGARPGITGANGLVSFIIPADGNYNVTATVNGQPYSATQVSIVAASPPTTTTWINMLAGVLSVAVPPGGTGWSRYIGIYDSSNSLVASGTATVAQPTPTFVLPGGMYTVTVCGTLATLPLPATLPANTANKYKNYALTAPGVPINTGGTYFLTNALAPN